MACDGTDALQMLNRKPAPCLTLLDLKMWPMSGAEFLQRLARRADASHFPVVLITGDRDHEAIQSAAGVVATLGKPFDLDALRALLARFS